MNRKIRVLFLPKWYPHRYDPMPGLFIQRQAESITTWCDVAVIYVHPDPSCPNKYEVEFSEENEVRVLRVYYKVPPDVSSALGKALGMWRFYRACMKAVHSIREFSPDIIHAHILTRLGFIAWSVARKKKIPFIISEHWSRYFPENNTYKGWIRKWITQFIVGKASALIAVSEPLKNAMKESGLDNPNFYIIPNVVDTGLFKVTNFVPVNNLKNFIHISCFEDRSKNISGFLDAVLLLSKKRTDFRCLLVGEGPDWNNLKEYARMIGLNDNFVSFTGLQSGIDLVNTINQADFTVVSSFYETFGTIVIESLSCGIPVVSTRVGVAVAEINEGNGLLVQAGDQNTLADALCVMLDRCRSYNREEIAAGIIGKYDKKTIGSQIIEVYRTVIPEDNL